MLALYVCFIHFIVLYFAAVFYCISSVKAHCLFVQFILSFKIVTMELP